MNVIAWVKGIFHRHVVLVRDDEKIIINYCRLTGRLKDAGKFHRHIEGTDYVMIGWTDTLDGVREWIEAA